MSSPREWYLSRNLTVRRWVENIFCLAVGLVAMLLGSEYIHGAASAFFWAVSLLVLALGALFRATERRER